MEEWERLFKLGSMAGLVSFGAVIAAIAACRRRRVFDWCIDDRLIICQIQGIIVLFGCTTDIALGFNHLRIVLALALPTHVDLIGSGLRGKYCPVM